MWIRFKNNVTVNIDAVIKFEKTTYGSGIVFYCNGLGFTLMFKSFVERNEAFDNINKAIIEKNDFVDIDIEAKTIE